MLESIATVSGITTAISLTKQLIELVKTAKDAKAKLDLAELQLKLADLLTELAEQKVKTAELIEERDQLKRELARATNQVAEVVIRDGLYYKAENGDGPYCTTCYDSRKQLIRVATMDKMFDVIGKWRCGLCKSHFQ